MKIMTIVGARPQFVKAATISRVIENLDGVEEVLVHTGQHFDQNMSDVFFEEMQISKPAFQLDVNSVGHGAMTGRMMEKIEELLLQVKPDAVLVYGDTNSTLAGALAAKKIHIPVAHVEAGLRSFNDLMPEEVNRILTDRVSTNLYCPTDTAVNNLKKEGYDNLPNRIVRTGDVMYDAALFYSKFAEAKSSTKAPEKDFILATVHRAENTDNPLKLKGIVQALNQLNEQLEIVLPLHPRTKKYLEKNGLELSFKSIAPIGYFDMINLLDKASLVVTDSGGVQKEAFFFRNNCVTLRDQTEWVELVEHGYNVLANAEDPKDIEHKVRAMLAKESDFDIDLYGAGNAAEVIVDDLVQHFKNKK
jgi:UDP-GlcNAc3NAcA epimerase